MCARITQPSWRHSHTHGCGGDIRDVGPTGERNKLLLDPWHPLLSHVVLVWGRDVIHDVLFVVGQDAVDATQGGRVLHPHVLIQVVVALVHLVLQRGWVAILLGLFSLFCYEQEEKINRRLSSRDKWKCYVNSRSGQDVAGVLSFKLANENKRKQGRLLLIQKHRFTVLFGIFRENKTKSGVKSAERNVKLQNVENVVPVVINRMLFISLFRLIYALFNYHT